MNMIPRPFYLSRIQTYLDKPFVKVLTGMRRVGKSTLLAQAKESLRARGVPEAQILCINKDLLAWDAVRDYRDLDRIIQERLADQPEPRYLMVDEVQEIQGWEKAINSVLAQGLADILITGSNARLLSMELATLLTGRYVEIPVYPSAFQNSPLSAEPPGIRGTARNCSASSCAMAASRASRSWPWKTTRSSPTSTPS
jgi:predicted AAA+ superfamily ATPase